MGKESLLLSTRLRRCTFRLLSSDICSRQATMTTLRKRSQVCVKNEKGLAATIINLPQSIVKIHFQYFGQKMSFLNHKCSQVYYGITSNLILHPYVME